MIAILALLLATAFPSTDKTSWMRPESFHLVIGMPREEAMHALQSNGWKAKSGDDGKQLIVDYTDDKGLAQKLECDRLVVSVGRVPNTDGLGAATVWTGKSADVATAHVASGALSLMTGAMLAIIAFSKGTISARLYLSARTVQ